MSRLASLPSFLLPSSLPWTFWSQKGKAKSEVYESEPQEPREPHVLVCHNMRTMVEQEAEAEEDGDHGDDDEVDEDEDGGVLVLEE